MTRPRLLDLFSGAGGAAEGYRRAGFDVVGVDSRPMPRYPFEFHRADALEYLAAHGREFDAIHASPPCQAYSVTRHSHSIQHPELIDPVRDLLLRINRPYVIENVVGAPLHDPIILCGTEFGLNAFDPALGITVQLQRHRLFESDVRLDRFGECDHKRYPIAGVYGGGSSRRSADRTDWKGGPGRGGYTPLAAVRGELMEIDWMTRDELSQAIPPIYTSWIGSYLREAVS